VHTPAVQLAPVAQVFPQLPQFSASALSPVVHPPPQSVVPEGQPQSPLVQVAPGLQAFPQPPQLAASVARSAQSAPHITRLPAQAQAPEMQLAPVPQALPQLPQLAASVDGSTQSAPHVTSPVPHAQTPSVHVCPVAQAFPQRPQLVPSVVMSTQLPPHSAKGAQFRGPESVAEPSAMEPSPVVASSPPPSGTGAVPPPPPPHAASKRHSAAGTEILFKLCMREPPVSSVEQASFPPDGSANSRKLARSAVPGAYNCPDRERLSSRSLGCREA